MLVITEFRKLFLVCCYTYEGQVKVAKNSAERGRVPSRLILLMPEESCRSWETSFTSSCESPIMSSECGDLSLLLITANVGTLFEQVWGCLWMLSLSLQRCVSCLITHCWRALIYLFAFEHERIVFLIFWFKWGSFTKVFLLCSVYLSSRIAYWHHG